MWKCLGPIKIAELILYNLKKYDSFPLDFKTYHKARIIKTRKY